MTHTSRPGVSPLGITSSANQARTQRGSLSRGGRRVPCSHEDGSSVRAWHRRPVGTRHDTVQKGGDAWGMTCLCRSRHLCGHTNPHAPQQPAWPWTSDLPEPQLHQVYRGEARVPARLAAVRLREAARRPGAAAGPAEGSPRAPLIHCVVEETTDWLGLSFAAFLHSKLPPRLRSEFHNQDLASTHFHKGKLLVWAGTGSTQPMSGHTALRGVAGGAQGHPPAPAAAEPLSPDSAETPCFLAHVDICI